MKQVSPAYMAEKLAIDCKLTECTMVHAKDDTVITVTVNGRDYDLTPWGVVIVSFDGEKVKSNGPLFRAIYENMKQKLGK